MARPRTLLDRFTLAVLSVAAFATVLPCRGSGASVVAIATKIAITLLFFFHGARLAPEAVRAGIRHWRLHTLILLSTFGMFPLLGLALCKLGSSLVTPALVSGILFLCLVPSTVQSSIAFTALARGNVAAAVCSASASSLVGIVLTPLLVRATGLARGADSHPGAVALAIASELLLPFVAGQVARPYLRGWVERRRGALRLLDQGSILLVIYGAFSRAVLERVWAGIPAHALLGLLPLTAGLLACALLITWRASGWLGFNQEDRIAALFCGSKKSLASGVPLATVLFPAQLLSVMVLPLVVFHQLQLMVCSLIAQRCAARD